MLTQKLKFLISKVSFALMALLTLPVMAENPDSNTQADTLEVIMAKDTLLIRNLSL